MGSGPSKAENKGKNGPAPAPRAEQTGGTEPPPPQSATTLVAKNQADNQKTICYITDAEGNGFYFFSCLNRFDPVVDFYGDKLTWSKGFEDTGCFVYGGDTVDKSNSDRLITNSLVDFKKRYPARVILILGNRDVNKLRLYNELHEDMDNVDTLLDPLEISNHIYWDKNVWSEDGNMSYAVWIKKGDAKLGFKNIDNSCLGPDGTLPHSWLSILLWILHCTMGAQPAFESRRQELARDADVSVEHITNKQIYNSFYQSVNPNGDDPWMLEYARLGQIAGHLGNTIFVHGAFTKTNLYLVPGRATLCLNMQEWFHELNTWASGQVGAWIDAFKKTPAKSPKDKAHGASLVGPLLDYGLINIPLDNRGPTTPPYHHSGTSVMYNNWLVNGNPVAIDKEVSKFLSQNQVDIFTGHQPHGDAPVVMLGDGVALDPTRYIPMIMSTDTSYSDPCRSAHTSVTIFDDHVQVEGILADGRYHGFTMPRDPRQRSRSLVGRQLPDGYWVKTFTQGQAYVVKGVGFSLINRLLEERFLRQTLTGVQPFPKGLGPFVFDPLPPEVITKLKLVDKGWTLSADAALSDSANAFVSALPKARQGSVSPMGPITLTGVAKAAAGIPNEATHVRFCHSTYTAADEVVSAVSGKGVNFSDQLICFMTVGGFAYFCQGKLIGVNVIRPDIHGGLQFDGCWPWQPSKTPLVQPVSRWVPIRSPGTDVKYCCWLSPGETVEVEPGRTELLSKHGGFVFLTHEPDHKNPPPSALGRNMHYPLLGPDQHISELMPEWLKNEVTTLEATVGPRSAGSSLPFCLCNLW